MEQKLCWRCREAWGKVFNYHQINLMELVHCHHDEPEEKVKEKCICETYKTIFYRGWGTIEKNDSANFCPQCGKRLQ